MSWLWIAAAAAAILYVLGSVALERQAKAARASKPEKEPDDAE